MKLSATESPLSYFMIDKFTKKIEYLRREVCYIKSAVDYLASLQSPPAMFKKFPAAMSVELNHILDFLDSPYLKSDTIIETINDKTNVLSSTQYMGNKPGLSLLCTWKELSALHEAIVVSTLHKLKYSHSILTQLPFLVPPTFPPTPALRLHHLCENMNIMDLLAQEYKRTLQRYFNNESFSERTKELINKIVLAISWEYQESDKFVNMPESLIFLEMSYFSPLMPFLSTKKSHEIMHSCFDRLLGNERQVVAPQLDDTIGEVVKIFRDTHLASEGLAKLHNQAGLLCHEILCDIFSVLCSGPLYGISMMASALISRPLCTLSTYIQHYMGLRLGIIANVIAQVSQAFEVNNNPFYFLGEAGLNAWREFKNLFEVYNTWLFHVFPKETTSHASLESAQSVKTKPEIDRRLFNVLDDFARLTVSKILSDRNNIWLLWQWLSDTKNVLNIDKDIKNSLSETEGAVKVVEGGMLPCYSAVLNLSMASDFDTMINGRNRPYLGENSAFTILAYGVKPYKDHPKLGKGTTSYIGAGFDVYPISIIPNTGVNTTTGPTSSAAQMAININNLQPNAESHYRHKAWLTIGGYNAICVATGYDLSKTGGDDLSKELFNGDAKYHALPSYIRCFPIFNQKPTSREMTSANSFFKDSDNMIILFGRTAEQDTSEIASNRRPFADKIAKIFKWFPNNQIPVYRGLPNIMKFCSIIEKRLSNIYEGSNKKWLVCKASGWANIAIFLKGDVLPIDVAKLKMLVIDKLEDSLTIPAIYPQGLNLPDAAANGDARIVNDDRKYEECIEKAIANISEMSLHSVTRGKRVHNDMLKWENSHGTWLTTGIYNLANKFDCNQNFEWKYFIEDQIERESKGFIELVYSNLSFKSKGM